MSKLCVVALIVWYLDSNGGWDRSSTLPTPDSSGKWVLFSELGGSSLQRSSERHLPSVPVAPAPGVEELDTDLSVLAEGGWSPSSLPNCFLNCKSFGRWYSGKSEIIYLGPTRESLLFV